MVAPSLGIDGRMAAELWRTTCAEVVVEFAPAQPGGRVHKIAPICPKAARNIVSSPRSCLQTWSATALSRNATNRSHLNGSANTADSCAQFFQNIRALKSRQLEMVS